MTLRLYYHPLSSYCWKTLIGLYEIGAPFTPQLVNFGDPADTAAFKALWPIGKFPVLRDEKRDHLVAESSTILEYLDQYYPGPAPLIPREPDLARQTRFYDRVFDLHIHTHMQKIVGDIIRPQDKKDPFGVEQARAAMNTALALFNTHIAGKTWVMGDAFTMADCSAAPALYYVNWMNPLSDAYPNVAAYLTRLTKRESFARVITEAEPYFHMFPGAPK